MDNVSNRPLAGMQSGLNNNVSSVNSDVTSNLQANTDKKSIKAVIKNSGEISGYELSSGEQITKQKGVELAKSGAISGVSVSTSRKGEEYLRSLPDEDESNNLSSLPTIEQ